MTKALELAKFGRETPPTGVVVGDSDAQTLSSKTFSDGPVFSGLNANGIPYLNASKVLSSSSTFVFDGTNVGLGIASPAATLHVNASGGGTIRASRSSVGGEYVQLDHDGTDGTLRVSGNNKLYLTTNGSTQVTVNGSGNVGIGTDPSTGAKLQVTGYTDFWNSTNTLLRLQHDGTRGRLQAYTSGATGNIGINSEGGNVGIGTDSPVRNFTVYAATNARMLIQNANYNGAINKGLDLVLQSTGEAQLWNYQNNYLAFGTNNQERVYISAAGKVGIGTSLPTEILTISHSDYQALGIYRNLDYNSVGAMGVRMYFGGYVGSTATASAAIDGTLMTATTGRLSLSNLIGGTLTESLRIDTNGSIRIGGNLAAISATNEKLTVDGGTSQAATLASSSNSAAVLYLKNKSNTAATIQPYLYFNDADGGNRGGIGVKITDASTHQFAQGGFTWYTGSAGFSGPKLILTDIGQLVIGDTSSQYSSKLYVNGAIAARHGGVDGTYQPAFIAGYTSNYTESNVISTAVSSAAGGSGFRFEVSDGAGLASRTSTVLFKRNQAQFNTPVYVGGQLSIGGNSLYFEKSGTRSWQLYADQSNGNAILQSGDGLGTAVIAPDLQLNNTLIQGRWRTRNLPNLAGGYYRGYGVSSVARHEVARIGIDYNDWNSVGTVIIELSEVYFSTGGYSKWMVGYGYVQNSYVRLMEAQGSWQNAAVTIGSPVQVSGDIHYLPVYVEVQGYQQFDARITTTHNYGADNTTPTNGYVSVYTNYNITNPGTTVAPVPAYATQNVGIYANGAFYQANYAQEYRWGDNTFVQIRAGKRTGTGTYNLFTRGNSSAQSSGIVKVQAIYGTPAGAGYWEYVITGNKSISLITSNTSVYSGSTPSVYWSGDTLQVDNTNSSVYYTVIVELHNIGQGWDVGWGDFPGIVAA